MLGGLNTLAFDISAQVPPSSWYGTLLKGTVNLSPQTTVLQAIVWTLYIVPVMALFFWGDQPAPAPRRERGARAARPLPAGRWCCSPAAAAAARRRRRPRAAPSASPPATAPARRRTPRSPPGTRTFSVKNSGSQITEVYVYGAGDRVMGEVENIGPSTGRDLVVAAAAGQLRGRVQAGHDRQRHPPAADRHRRRPSRSPSSAQLQAAVDGYRRFVTVGDARRSSQLTIPFAAAIKAGDIEKAKRLYARARVHYERIEPIAESFPRARHRDRHPRRRRDQGPEVDRVPPARARPLAARRHQPRRPARRPARAPTSSAWRRRSRRSRSRPTSSATARARCSTRSPRARSPARRSATRTPTSFDFQGNLDGAKTAYAELRPIVVARDPALATTLDERFATLQTLLSTHATKARLQALHRARPRRDPRARGAGRRRRGAAVARDGGRADVTARPVPSPAAAGRRAGGAGGAASPRRAAARRATPRRPPPTRSCRSTAAHQAGIATAGPGPAALRALRPARRHDPRRPGRPAARPGPQAAAAMTAGAEIGGARRLERSARPAAGHRRGARPARVAADGHRRLRPVAVRRALRPRRAPPGRARAAAARSPDDALDPARSDGDLCIQACADDPQVAVHAVRNLARLAHGVAAVRFSQLGFGRTSSTTDARRRRRATSSASRTAPPTSRPRTSSAMRQHVWVAARRRRQGGVDGRRLLPGRAPDPDDDRDLGPRLARRPGAGHRPPQAQRRAVRQPGRVRHARPAGQGARRRPARARAVARPARPSRHQRRRTAARAAATRSSTAATRSAASTRACTSSPTSATRGRSSSASSSAWRASTTTR